MTIGEDQIAQTLPDITLPLVTGGELRLQDLRGKRWLLFMWGSWWGCRDQLPGWQRFAAAHASDDFGIVSIAIEHAGLEAARRIAADAGTTFPTAYDGHGTFSRHYDFKAVPNGLLVDADGVVRWAKFGGFSVDDPDDVATVERFLGGEDPGPSPIILEPYVLGPVERELIQTKLRLGELLLQTGQRVEALVVWQDALRLDPENLTIRKQIWAAAYPEKFFPEIDFAWQQEQLARERSDEIADGVCGPDGCPLPWR